MMDELLVFVKVKLVARIWAADGSCFVDAWGAGDKIPSAGWVGCVLTFLAFLTR